MKYKYYLVALLLCKSIICSAQPVSPGTEVQELVKIAEVYANIPYLSFNMRQTFADSLTWHDLTDSLLATSKISYGRSFISNSQIEFLRGNEYNVFVDKEDSTIFVSRRQDFETVFQMPLLDSVFRDAHVQSMNISVISAETWKFSVIFKPESNYSFYEMRYNPQTGLISWLNYHAKNESGGHDIPEDHVVCAFFYIDNYSETGYDPAVFNEQRYFYVLNGTMYLQPAWQQFELHN